MNKKTVASFQMRIEKEYHELVALLSAALSIPCGSLGASTSVDKDGYIVSCVLWLFVSLDRGFLYEGNDDKAEGRGCCLPS